MTKGLHDRLDFQLFPETRGEKEGAPDVSGLAVDTGRPCSAARNSSTMYGESNFKLSDDEATTSVNLPR